VTVSQPSSTLAIAQSDAVALHVKAESQFVIGTAKPPATDSGVPKLGTSAGLSALAGVARESARKRAVTSASKERIFFIRSLLDGIELKLKKPSDG
jgi:hypothetical protein